MSAVLECRGLTAGYGGGAVVRGLDLTVEPGLVTVLLGPNGAGKTTTMLTLAGLVQRMSGELVFRDAPIRRADPVRLAKDGLVLVPDDRSLFRSLTTRENLLLGQRRAGRRLDEVLGYFPALAKRLGVKAGFLSGGEQQMLAVARGLIQRPSVLLVDELSMGLAPITARSLLRTLRAIATAEDLGIVLVEQHVTMALEIADRATVMVHGEASVTGDAAWLREDVDALRAAYLGK
jgi:branched-chain amino acid transport system ATP-binding protein